LAGQVRQQAAVFVKKRAVLAVAAFDSAERAARVDQRHLKRWVCDLLRPDPRVTDKRPGVSR